MREARKLPGRATWEDGGKGRLLRASPHSKKGSHDHRHEDENIKADRLIRAEHVPESNECVLESWLIA